MKVGDLFKINISNRGGEKVIYEAKILSDDQEWVSAQVVYPTELASRLKSEGYFRIHLATIDISILGNNLEGDFAKVIYG